MRFALAFLLLISACTTANVGAGAEGNQTQVVTLDLPPSEAYRTAAQEAVAYGWTVENSDPATGLIRATYEGALSRFGDTVTIAVAPAPGGATVTVRSTLGQGPNRRHVAGYLARLSPSDTDK